MRQLGYLVAVLVVMVMAFWAYRENYRTQTQAGEMSRLRGEIAQLRESLGLLRAEWAWLNRPDRIRELADLNFDRLQLIPLTPDHFIAVPQIAFPAPAGPPMPDGDGPDGDILTGPDDALPGIPAAGLVPRPPLRPKTEVMP